MRFVRSERITAFFLIVAAALGVILANSPAAAALSAFRDFHFGIPALGLDLSVAHWVTDGLLAVFFFLAAIELKHELRHGELDSVKRALVPAVAALGGVIAPALIFLLLVRAPGLNDGWPIPTATDIAFALGILAIVGRSLPSRVRALLRRAGSDERQPADGDPDPTFHELRLDRGRHGALIDGEAFVELTRTEYQLLELLMDNPRQVLTHELIYERVWGYDFGPTSNALRVYIGYLRRKLERAGARPLVHTIRGVGYILREP